MNTKVTTIDEYLDGVDPAFRYELQRIRELVTSLVPDVEQSISYRMSTLKYKERTLVYFTASKKHLSFYPSSWAIEELRARLSDYSTTERAIRFTPQNPLPENLIKDLVLYHVSQIDTGRQ